MQAALAARDTIRFGVFEVDLRAGELRKQGVKIKLQEQPFQILQILLEQPSEVVTREEIQRRLWPSDTFVDFEHGLYNAIKRLREALGDSAENPRFIETLSKRGYRFVGPINGVASASAAKEALGRNPARSSFATLLRKLVIGALGTLILAATVFALNLGGLRQRLLLKTNPPAIHSLAVLPLTSLSSDPNQEYFAEGMTDALITDLSQIGALRVVSRTSVMRYSKTDKSAPQISRELNVDAIIEGTVQRSGDRVRVTAQLIYGPKDQHLWADSYERDMQDAFALQGVVARAVADEIRVKLTPQERERLRSVRPVNPKALEDYLSGRFHLDQYDKLELYRDKERTREQELRKAIGYFDRAIERDPQYIPSYLWFFDGINSPSLQLDQIPRVEAGVATALQLDESNVRAHLWRARLLEQYEYDWPGAEKEIRRAIEISPNSAEAHFQYAEYFLCMGRKEDEKKERDLAQALDPSHDYFADAGTSRIGWTLEQHKQAVEERAPDDPLSRCVLAKNYAIAGRFDEAAEEYEKCLRLYGYNEVAEAIHASRTKAGGKAALRDWMQAAEKEYLQGAQVPSYAFAFTYASLGDKDNVFRWLEKAYQERNWSILYLKADPVWEPIRSDPRFKEILRRVGLPP
jgi:TolB-like protein/DNA-binding winged helix-turn-helix (wHTH) protein